MYLPSCQARLIGAGRVMALADRSRLPGAGAATLQQGLSSLSQGRGDTHLLRVPAMLFVPPWPRGDRKPQPPRKVCLPLPKEVRARGSCAPWRDRQTGRSVCISSFGPDALLQGLSFGPAPGQLLSGVHRALLSFSSSDPPRMSVCSWCRVLILIYEV